MIDVVNFQRKVKLDTSEFRTYIHILSESVTEAEGKTFSVAFVSDKRMSELNRFFRGKDGTTDVLSFPMSDPPEVSGGSQGDAVHPPVTTGGSDFLGDVVISAEQAAKQADENDLSLETEIKQLILHGLLHLCGYDHETDEGEMNRRELELRQRLSI
jgi:probable rRNA maturation factor